MSWTPLKGVILFVSSKQIFVKINVITFKIKIAFLFEYCFGKNSY